MVSTILNNAELQLLPGIGHIEAITHSDIVNSRIDAFIDDQDMIKKRVADRQGSLVSASA